MGLIVTTPPAAEPLALADARRQCRIAPDETREDVELQGWIAAARRQAERSSGRAIVARSLRYTFDSFPGWWVRGGYRSAQLPGGVLPLYGGGQVYNSEPAYAYGGPVYAEPVYGHGYYRQRAYQRNHSNNPNPVDMNPYNPW